MILKEDIIRVLHETNFWGKEQYTGIPRRKYLTALSETEKMKEATVLVGVRRCGKSTMAKQFLRQKIETGKISSKDTLYVNFEEPIFAPHLNLGLLELVYEAYLENVNPEGGAFVVLDEVQNIPGWEKWVAAMQERNERMKLIVTGSTSKLLASEFSTVLSGRSVPLKVFPLSFQEFVEFKRLEIKKVGEVFVQQAKINSLLKEYMEFGAFPRVVLETNSDNKKLLLNEYFETIVLHDVAERYGVKAIDILRSLAITLLTNFASRVSIGKLTKVLRQSFRQNVSLETVSRFMHYFESAFLVFFVPVFSYKIKEQMQYPRKAYCIDSGLRNSVAFKFSEDLGRLYENIVFLELKRKGEDIYYWKDAQNKEVDFVIKRGLKPSEAIQVCFDIEQESTKKREFSAMVECLDELKLAEGLVITQSKEGIETVEGGKKIMYLPLWKWLLIEE